MKQKMFLTAAALVLLFLSASPTRAGEITVNWRTQIDSSSIWDLKFMPGQDEFIIGTTYDLQVRKCEDGSILKTYAFGALKIEFTPDSNRIILLPTGGTLGRIQIRNVDDMALIKEYILTPDEEGFSVSFSEIAVDPVRPFIYAIWTSGKDSLGNWIHYRKILIFDRETLNPIGELTTTEDEELLLVNMAVSMDGKYLAVMNEGKISKLMVWSLETRQKIVDKYIADQNSVEFSDPADVKFSELNSDKIFFTGNFYQYLKDPLEGLCIFSISENRIIDSTFAFILGGKAIGASLFSFFENESKMIVSAPVNLYILDLVGKKQEYKKFYLDGELVFAGNAVYNSNNKFFIGSSRGTINKFSYFPNTSVPEKKTKETIYPNPTTGIVNIPMNCVNTSKYEIYNSGGNLIKSSILPGVSGNFLTIDFTQYPVGVYSVKVYCGKQVEQYQVVRGE